MHVLALNSWKALVVLAIMAGAASCHRAPLTVDEIIARNTQAMGGDKAIEAVQAIAVDVTIIDPSFEVDGVYRAARPGRMRIDVKTEGKHVFTEAFDGERGWQWKGEGTPPVEATAKATAAFLHGVELAGPLYRLQELRQRGHRIELVGREKIEGIDYFALRLTLEDGYTNKL